jgi:hypothetical protein
MDNMDSIKVRIKKLLALSKSPNENEAQSALEKAQKLLDEYHLSESAFLYERHSVPATKRASRWRSVLASAIAWLYYCYKYRDESSGMMVFYGESFDAFMAGEMFGYLAKTIERMTKLNIRKNAKTKFRENYKFGIACALYNRIQELGKAASWAPLRDSKIFAAKTALESEVNLTVKNVKFSGESSNAFKRGAFDANGISLNRQTTASAGRNLECK